MALRTTLKLFAKVEQSAFTNWLRNASGYRKYGLFTEFFEQQQLNSLFLLQF